MRRAAIITKPLQVLLLILRMFLTKMSFYSMIVHGSHQLFLLFTFFMRFLPIEKKLHKILFRKYWRKSLNKMICSRPPDHCLIVRYMIISIIHDKNLNCFIEALNFQIEDTKYTNSVVN